MYALQFSSMGRGYDRLNQLRNHTDAYAVVKGWLESYLCDMSSGEVTDELINEILWFDVDDILAGYGFDPGTYEKKAVYE